MTYLMQRIDNDTSWFIVAVLVIILLSVLSGYIGARMEIAERDRKKRITKARRTKFVEIVYPDDLDTPAYLRQTRHPLDSKPYDIRKLN